MADRIRYGCSPAKGSGFGDDGGAWPGIRLVQKIIEKTNLPKIDPEEWGDYSVSFDVYNDTDTNERFSILFGTTISYGAMVGVDIPAKKWTKISYTLSEIAGVNAWAGTANENRITNPSDWQISWLDYTDMSIEKVFYFDNFRIEKN